MKRSPETFWLSLEALGMGNPTPEPGDLAALRARVERESDADELLEALGFADYPILARRDLSGFGANRHASLKPGVRPAQFGSTA